MINSNYSIVLVHGLQGHPEGTWSYTPETSTTRLSIKERLFGKRPSQTPTVAAPRESVFWPWDLLSQLPKFQDCRILTWGYETRVITEFFGGSDQQNMSQHGNNLMVSLQQERKKDVCLPPL